MKEGCVAKLDALKPSAPHPQPLSPKRGEGSQTCRAAQIDQPGAKNVDSPRSSVRLTPLASPKGQAVHGVFPLLGTAAICRTLLVLELYSRAISYQCVDIDKG